MALERLAARHELRFGDRHAGGLHDVLGALLVHGERGREHARMRVGNAEHLEDALHAAVLAELAVQRVEAGIGLQLGEPRGDVAADIDRR